MQPDWSYRFLRGPWDRLGDSFLLVAPKEIILWTCDAQVIHQITSRREAFPKQTSNYKILSIFGRNMLAAEGAEWKMHRKGVSASFNEKNAAHIFTESIKQTQGMIAYWMEPSGVDGKEEGDGQKATARSPTINTLEHDTMTLALNIIAHVGFGLRLLWPGQKMPEDADAKSKRYGSAEPPRGHSLTFADSLAMVLERILLVLIVPPWLLRVLPFQATRAAWAARWNYEEYMHEFLRDKTEAAQRQSEGDGERGEEGMDIMGQLVRTKYGKNKKSYSSSKTQGTKPADELTDSDIMGNSFVILLAGHETTANTLHFTLVELATNPAAQRALQADVDRLLGTDSDPLGWDYEACINALMASHVAACMNETLRLTPSVADIPKEVSAGAEQTITLGQDGEGSGSGSGGGRRRQHVLPRGTTIMLNTIGAHRNPRYWPAAGGEGDLDKFLPERWFRPSMNVRGEAAAAEEEQEEDYGGFQGPDTSAQLYRPVRGSFIPFSDGPRSCLGRRIAQVEMVAALAVLFQRYSVELAVDEWATDEQVEAMGREERRALYEKARGKAKDTVRMASSLLTLKLHGELKVSVRLVRRGEERFLGLEDA